jgi:filamentous hemagglutinin family protein
MAKTREQDQVRLLGVTGRKRTDLLIGTALQTTTLLVLACPGWAQPAPNAMPVGGSVVAGSATITQTANSTAITQASQRAAINWQSFNVGSQQQVTFAQPSSSAVALNRVIGPDPSQIAGKISANGQVVLVNQAGVTFYKGAQVNVQSLIVTSANLSNANFMAGKLVFDQAGGANASVVNQGTITVKQAGLAALVAPSVANSGVINAQLGHVVLAGAKTATLDLYGDGLLSLDVSNQVTKAPVGPGGKTVTALVTNSGVINADGGTVQLTAAAADGVLQNLVQAGGKIAANTVGAQTGTVTVAGIGGSVTVTGLLSASGQAAGTTGGQVAVNATGNVTLASSARIDASGSAGGGTVAIGTTPQRANGGPGTISTMTAANVTVRKGATITASAGKTGNGGRVAVLSAGTTTMNGSISATGGSKSGNGGFVEVSGTNLTLSGIVDVLAPHGTVGTILLDPTNLDIVGGTTPTSSSVDGEFVTAAGTSTLASSAADGTPLPSTVFASTLNNLGLNGNVIVQASGIIDVQVPVTVNNGLTMQAGGNLTIETGASIQAGGNILLQAGAANPAGALVINAGVISNAEGGTVQLIAGTGGITLNGNISANTVDLNATGGGVTQATNVGITANTLQSSNGVTGNVGLLGTNSVNSVGGFTVTAASPGQGNFQLIDTVPLEVFGPVATPGGNVFLQDTSTEDSNISIFGPVTTGTAGLASFQANSFNIGSGEVPGTISTGTFELAPFSPGQTVTLGGFFAPALFLSDLTNINAQGVRIGAVTPPGATAPVTEAAAITISGTGGTFDLGNRNLELDATGAIDGSDGSLVNVATLSGTGGAWTLTSTNTIANLGAITASSFALVDGIGLNVTGSVNGGSSATITDTGALTISGGVSAAAVSLSGDSINIPGLVTDGGAGTVNLVANTGTINETGTLIAGILSGTAVGVADLLGAGSSVNQVATLGSPAIFGELQIPGRNFTASSFALRDGVGLTVAGTVTATSATGQVFLASTAPAGITIATTGNVAANALTGTASLQTDFLADNATTGVTANTVELAPATAGGAVTLGATGSGLSLPSMTGLVANNLLVGAVTQPNATAPTISAGSIAITGAFAFTGSGTLTLDAASSTAAGASGAVTQSAPLTGVPVLSGTADSFTLTNSGNAITTVANLTATNGDATLVDGVNLTLSGTISGDNLFVEVAATGGTLTIGRLGEGDVPVRIPASLTAASGGRISLVADTYAVAVASSTITAPSGVVELAPFSAINTSLLGNSTSGQLLIDTTLLSIITPGISTLVVGGFTNVPAGATSSAPSAASVTIDGTLTLAPIATALDLEATGSVTQSAPIVNVGTLLGTSALTVLTNAGNTIATLGNYTASNGFNLTDATSLNIAGELQAGPSATFNVNGALTESGGLTTTVLTGNASGTASFTGINSIAELDGFVVTGDAGSLVLQDRGVLLINGTLNATRIAVSSTQITLGDGTTIVTGGTVRPAGLVPPASLFPQNGAPGAAFLSTTFTQIGSATVTGQNGGPSVLQIGASGNVQFDPPLGLFAPGTWLILNVPNGTVTGNVYVGALDVRYRQPGAVNLFGAIDGNSGPTAAGLGFIQPEPNQRYLFNGCEIGAMTCTGTLVNAPALQVENTVFVPVDALLALVTPGLVLEPEDKDDLLQLPVVSREDY